jgi:hypothetical protein
MIRSRLFQDPLYRYMESKIAWSLCPAGDQKPHTRATDRSRIPDRCLVASSNDFYRAFSMASNGFRHVAQQETLYASPPVRTNHNQIGLPFRCGIEDPHSDVTYFDSGTCLSLG